MSDLLAEVDEAIRQEKLEKFWHENKTFIIAFIALTILSTAVMSAYRSWDASTKTKQTTQILALQNDENYPANIIEAELDMRASLRGITLLSAAGTAMQKNNREDAQKLYARLIEDTKIPDEFRHLGILMDTRLKMDNDDANEEELLSALSPVLKGKSTWKPHALIDAALLESETNQQAALDKLNEIADTADLPPSLYERAEKLHHVISAKTPATSESTTN